MAASRRIAVTGASGFVGRAVCALLEESGQEVVRIRSRSTDDGGFDVRTDWIDRKAIRTCSAVIHLAGAPIARRWGRQARHDILESRVDSTGLIARALAELRPSGGPSTFLCMSGVNRYGTVRSGTLTESSAGLEEGFLAQVTAGWEEAAAPAV
ncbi:MAG: NAD-dependent epimerase/dehydratase family protein, partial [Opitutales bacterium]